MIFRLIDTPDYLFSSVVGMVAADTNYLRYLLFKFFVTQIYIYRHHKQHSGRNRNKQQQIQRPARHQWRQQRKRNSRPHRIRHQASNFLDINLFALGLWHSVVARHRLGIFAQKQRNQRPNYNKNQRTKNHYILTLKVV